MSVREVCVRRSNQSLFCFVVTPSVTTVTVHYKTTPKIDITEHLKCMIIMKRLEAFIHFIDFTIAFILKDKHQIKMPRMAL